MKLTDADWGLQFMSARPGTELPTARRHTALAGRLSMLGLCAFALLSVAGLPLHGQTQGEPGVGINGGGSFVSSPSLLDATQFGKSGDDMCAKIADTCASTSPIPGGTTIDARGFTGNQVCKATTVTTMLNNCATNCGKLLLGLVNLYADGPSNPNNYQDGHGSGIGTPAFIIPNKFWGIEGVSRGSGNGGSTVGTFLSVCTAPNTPVGTSGLPPATGSPSCSTAFPVRSFTVNSVSVTGNTMSMSVTPAPIWSGSAENIYPGELVMMKGNTFATAENGSYRVQNSSGSTINVTVPTGTPSCSPPRDTSAANACRAQVTLGTPTTLTITGTSPDTINYIRIGRS